MRLSLEKKKFKKKGSNVIEQRKKMSSQSCRGEVRSVDTSPKKPN